MSYRPWGDAQGNPSETMARRALPGNVGKQREHELFEHPSDVGVRGWGASLSEAIANAGRALFELTTDTKRVQPRDRIPLEVSSPNRDTLLVEFLNELIAEMDLHGMVFCALEEARIWRRGRSYVLTAAAVGERLCRGLHETRVEPKAATYSQLFVGQVGRSSERRRSWIAQCVVDI